MSGIAEMSRPSLLSRLFRTKSLDRILQETQHQEHQLKKTLSAFDLVIFGVGAMIGAGIFALCGSAAVGVAGHPGAGPAVVVAFVIVGIICGFCALCYSEFSSMAPISGSAYTYAFSTMGEFIAWIIGWALVLEYAVGNMAVAVSWTGHVKEFLATQFGMTLPAALTSNTLMTEVSLDKANPELLLKSVQFTIPFTHDQYYLLIQKAFNVPAFIIVALITGLLFFGVSESARTAAVMVFIKTSVILLFIAVGAVFLFGNHGANLSVAHTNWFANGWDTFAPNGWPGILAGASTIFFAYIGFDAVSTAAEETRNPQRDIPIGIMGSLAICTILYIGVSALVTAVTPLDKINTEAAVVGAMRYMGDFPWAQTIINIGAIAGLTSVMLVLQLGGTRIFYAISRDGLLPAAFSKVHPVFKTPHIGTILVGVFVALGAGLLPIGLLSEMCNIGTLGAFLVVCAGVAMLRFSDPDRPRPFRTPLGLTFPIIGGLGCLIVMLFLAPTTWVVTIGWFLLGMALYFGYGFWNSKLNHTPQG